jgi:hypothetical protein
MLFCETTFDRDKIVLVYSIDIYGSVLALADGQGKTLADGQGEKGQQNSRS